MARLPYSDGSDPAAADALARIAGERGAAFNVYRMLARSAPVLETTYGLAHALWSQSLLERPLQEVVILRVAQRCRCRYEWGRHEQLAVKAGVTSEQLAWLGRWDEPRAPFDARTRAVLAAADELVDRDALREPTVARLADVLGPRGVVELLMLVGLYRALAGLLNSLDVELEPGTVTSFAPEEVLR